VSASAWPYSRHPLCMYCGSILRSNLDRLDTEFQSVGLCLSFCWQGPYGLVIRIHKSVLNIIGPSKFWKRLTIATDATGFTCRAHTLLLHLKRLGKLYRPPCNQRKHGHGYNIKKVFAGSPANRRNADYIRSAAYVLLPNARK
jgi:hypothetical protein